MTKRELFSRSLAAGAGVAAVAAALVPAAATASRPRPDSPVAYVVRSGDGNQDIHVVRPGGEPRALTRTPELEGHPEWSPDGKKIAFYKREAVPAGECCPEYTADLYVMDADGSGVTRLTDHPANEVAPTWSPDGRRIAFISDRGPDIRPRVFSIRADGTSGRARKLSEIRAIDISWSPRAPVIAVTNHGAGDSRTGIRLLDLETGRARWVTRSSRSAWSVDWAGSGDALAYTLSGRSGTEARLVRLDGSRDRAVPTSGTETAGWATQDPAWGHRAAVAYTIVGSAGDYGHPFDTPMELRVATLGARNDDTTLATVARGSYIVDVAW